MKNKTIIITGGGTGGHLSIAKAFIDKFYSLNYKVIFIGSLKGQDRIWFEDNQKIYKKYFLNTTGVVNQNFFGKIKALSLILKAILQSANIIQKNRVSKIISVGGFSAAPASFAAILLKKDFYIHEQNSIMGKLNKITSKFAKEVFSSYDTNSKVKDYPINQEFFNYQRVKTEIKTIIFLGGSQGAVAINNFALKIAPKLIEKGIKIIHQTGKNDYKRVGEEYKKLNLKVDLFDFSTNIIEKISKADFAISRSGASTLWELVALGTPALFIPYPYAASNHQYYNALFLAKKDLAFIQTEKELNEEYFFDILSNINIKDISYKLTQTIDKNGIDKIVDIIIEKQ